VQIFILSCGLPFSLLRPSVSLFLGVSRVPGCVVVRHLIVVETVLIWDPCHICVLIFLCTN